MDENRTCPICKSQLLELANLGADPILQLACPICGRYEASWELATILRNIRLSPTERAIASHAIRRMQSSDTTPRLMRDTWDRIAQSTRLPSPASQADNLIAYLGDNASAAGQTIDLNWGAIAAIAGALDVDGATFLVSALEDRDLVTSHAGADGTGVMLSFNGWAQYEALRRGRSHGRKGFMAMAYDNSDLQVLFLDYFKPAARRAGFDLIRLDEEPKAGSIDNRMRVEIRSSQFLLADLTDRNPGAYWEAGYAEGLGKPVIYSCEKGIWDKQRTHFDTSHMHTVLWNVEGPEESARMLTTTIRATLPDLATMVDD